MVEQMSDIGEARGLSPGIQKSNKAGLGWFREMLKGMEHVFACRISRITKSPESN